MTTYAAGPLRVSLRTSVPELDRRIGQYFSVFEPRWNDATLEVRLVAETSRRPAIPASGTFLRCYRMQVDARGGRLYATTACGASAERDETRDGGRWRLVFPSAALATSAIDEVEDLLSLALVHGWRRAGWTPLHGGAVVRGPTCAILCATSGGGKSTLTAALVRAGWRTLGDDKLLLRSDAEGGPEVAALLHTFNLHPRSREWFPELGDLELLPLYSAWTVKRKVRADDIWPGRTIERARPTHVVRVRRHPEPGPMRIVPLSSEEAFRTLVGQIAVPHDRAIVARDMATVSRLVRGGLRGYELVIGEAAYADPACLGPLEEALAA